MTATSKATGCSPPDGDNYLKYLTGFGNEFVSCHPDFPDALPQGQVSNRKERRTSESTVVIALSLEEESIEQRRARERFPSREFYILLANKKKVLCRKQGKH